MEYLGGFGLFGRSTGQRTIRDRATCPQILAQSFYFSRSALLLFQVGQSDGPWLSTNRGELAVRNRRLAYGLEQGTAALDHGDRPWYKQL